MYVYVCMYICIYMYMYVYVYMYLYMYMYVYIYIYMCVCVYIYMYIYIYTHFLQILIFPKEKTLKIIVQIGTIYLLSLFNVTHLTVFLKFLQRQYKRKEVRRNCFLLSTRGLFAVFLFHQPPLIFKLKSSLNLFHHMKTDTYMMFCFTARNTKPIF